MKLKTLFLFLIIFCLLGFSAVSSPIIPTSIKKTHFTQEDQLSKDVLRFNRELEVIKKEYVQPISDHELLKNAMQGMVSGLDPHSSLLDADDLEDLQTVTTGKFSGLGLEVAMEEGILRVITPIDGSPAKKAGIKPGDWILRINNCPIQGLTLREAVKKMRGQKGSSLQLMLVRKGTQKPLFITLKRDIILVQSVKGHLVEPGCAYIRINSFQAHTQSDLDKLLKQLQSKEKPIKGLILDLRNNPGGLLSSATDVANAFLDPEKMQYNQLIVYTKGQNAESNVKIVAKSNKQIYRSTLFVLINQGSASGAEIVAGALQDNKRAVIIGTKSFGKGSVQTIIPLDETTALKLTTALYYTPSGRSIQASGISPDIPLDDLKINITNENASNADYIHESELNGHLKSNNNLEKTNLIVPTTVEENNLVKNDYTLFIALNLMKSLVALEQKDHPQI